MVLKSWDGKLHFEGEPDRFARTRALFQNEDHMDTHDLLNVRWVIGGVFLLMASAWWWLLSAGSKPDLIAAPAKRERAEVIELLHQRAARRQRERA